MKWECNADPGVCKKSLQTFKHSQTCAKSKNFLHTIKGGAVVVLFSNYKLPFFMRKMLLSLCAIILISVHSQAQKIPVQSVTIFKNGRSMVERSGNVTTMDNRYVTRDLPEALFGTFWVGAPEDGVKSVFSIQDSVERNMKSIPATEYYRQLVGKEIRLVLSSPQGIPPMVKSGVLETVNEVGGSIFLVLKTAQSDWISVETDQVIRMEFSESPSFSNKTYKATQKRLEVQFNATKSAQPLNLAYLTDHLGWTPIYRLELSGKNKGHLALRAEVVNDAEDLGNTELRLAVGNPNFAFANRYSLLVDFDKNDNQRFSNEGQFARQNYLRPSVYMDDQDLNPYRGNNVAFEESKPEGTQAEDFYFYTIRPGNFPKGSRYQYPIFETAIAPTHFYECVLPEGGPNRLQQWRNSGNPKEEHNQVFHYIEFKNTTEYPWTTGAVNILSGTEKGELQPVSQDKLPYATPGAPCKVRIAESPEIRVTQNDGDIKREENVETRFSHNYDRITIEGEICAVNYKTEPVTLKVKRTIEGKPTISNDQKWTLTQEAATLRINSEYLVEWEMTLKPGEEKKWKYQYEVLMDF